MAEIRRLIPRQFQAGYKIWTVVLCETEKQYSKLIRRHGYKKHAMEFGCAMYRQHILALNAELHLCDEDLLQTFLHEVGHIVRHTRGETEQDEVEVDGEAMLYTQILLSALENLR